MLHYNIWHGPKNTGANKNCAPCVLNVSEYRGLINSKNSKLTATMAVLRGKFHANMLWNFQNGGCGIQGIPQQTI